VDDFTGRLYKLFKEVIVAQGGPAAQVELGINRFDYFITDDASPELKQVEMNTIAASFGCLSTRTSTLHKYTRALLTGTSGDLPPNNVQYQVASSIAMAHKLFLEVVEAASVRVVMVVQPGERNVYDQEALTESLMEDFGIDCVRMTLEDIADLCSVREGDSALVVDGSNTIGVRDQFVVSIVYFRAGYSPDDYISEKCWAARQVVERSAAAKCPSLAYQLVGTKKVQQVLDKEGCVEKFLGPREAQAVRQCFARQWSMSGEEGMEASKLALKDPSSYVLKPQREGGGNNFYGDEVAAAVKRMSADEKRAYVLMERIKPRVGETTLIRNGEMLAGSCVYELGMFGTLVAKKEVIANSEAGHLMRTKLVGVDEGGVAAGAAVLDSPELV